ncbi:hypothetical protein Syun_031446 [Stephania yunnanensis]|uniref:Protein kinase domain-containing protein n=1 Tax=Stephania yunnanensis TaxID=152371 RepID=A0AAP0HEU6_9MAGN
MAECEALRNVILNACSTVDFQGNDFKALIFKFMPNGSLENWLHPIASNGSYLTEQSILLLHWIIFYNHCETPIIHCDLKPSNILLDEDMVAHVGDFGQAKFLERNRNDSGTANSTGSFSPGGTVGYIPPEYGIGVKPSTQGDIYSYGVLSLEMFTGKRPTEEVLQDRIY